MEWEICSVNHKFVVGAKNLRSGEFDPICSCESYDKAEIICAALKHYIYAKNYAGKGMNGCPGATAKYLRPTARTGLPG